MSLSVSDEILCEIGRIAVYQSHIEGQMALFIQGLLYLDETEGNLVTLNLSFWEHMDLLGSLLRNEFGAQSKYVGTFDDFRKSMEMIVPQRNKFVHSMWGFGETFGYDTATMVKVVKDKSKGAVLKSVPVTLQELRDMSGKMAHLEWLISDLRVRICGEPLVRRRRAPQ
ncbi:MAG: hypothetical protein M3362_20105 [Acidobacteriota bacterium]|nr:hypothetical protein [Acidobacteriota bacterium]